MSGPYKSPLVKPVDWRNVWRLIKSIAHDLFRGDGGGTGPK